MTTGWTGGQYSALRAFVAMASMSVAMRPEAGVLTRLLAAGLGMLLAAGAYDRVAACGLLALLVLVDRPLGLAGSAVAAAPLLLHVLVPAAPFGSWAARHRDDPGGAWAMPSGVAVLAWIIVAAWHGWRAADSLAGGAEAGVAMIGVAVPLLALATRTRPVAWTLGVILTLAGGDPAPVPSLLALHGFAFDPAWIPPATRITPATVFYDGACGLCHRAVRFILAEDRRGTLRLAPLDGAAFARVLPADRRSGLPDSIVVCAADGRILVRAEGVNEVGAALGGLWRLVAEAGRLIPRAAGDRAYDWIASVRHRLFTPPERACPLVPEHLHARFADAPEDHPAASARR
jgi:predicted DCC family thiol-disulfide oxidoreductase YuxK